MASEFEPYPELPGEEGMSSAGLQVQRGNAEWAKMFEGGTTNLAQRARHAQQIRDYTASFEEQRAAEQAHRIATDKDAANFYLRSRAMDLNEKKTNFDIQDKIRKADAAALMAPTIKRANIAATNAQIASAERSAREAELKDRVQADADLFQADVAKALLEDPDEGEAYDRAVITAGAKYRLAKRDKDAGALFETAQKRHMTRTAEAEKAAKAGTLGMVPSGMTGGGAITFDTPTAAKPAAKVSDPELTTLKSRLGAAEANQATASPEEQPKYEPGLKALRDKIASLESSTKIREFVRDPATGKLVPK